jgi:hypothetical protein
MLVRPGASGAATEAAYHDGRRDRKVEGKGAKKEVRKEV